MLKQIYTTVVIAALAGVAGHAWKADMLPGDPGSDDVLAAQQDTVLGETSDPTANELSDSGNRVNAHLIDAALATTEPQRTAALRLAADALRADDAATADQFLLMAAGRGDLEALAQYAAAVDATADGVLLRREAAFLAASGGSSEAQANLERQRAYYRSQALSRPDVLAALAESRGLELTDTVETRRYLLGIMSGLQLSCPFQAALWEGSGFIRALELYSAPVVSVAHTKIASSVPEALSHATNSVVEFAKRMNQGGDYADAGAGLLRGLREAHRSYNESVSQVSEAGTRDGVRVAELMAGCSSADGMRITRALLGVFTAHAKHTPAAS